MRKILLCLVPLLTVSSCSLFKKSSSTSASKPDVNEIIDIFLAHGSNNQSNDTFYFKKTSGDSPFRKTWMFSCTYSTQGFTLRCSNYVYDHYNDYDYRFDIQSNISFKWGEYKEGIFESIAFAAQYNSSTTNYDNVGSVSVTFKNDNILFIDVGKMIRMDSVTANKYDIVSSSLQPPFLSSEIPSSLAQKMFALVSEANDYGKEILTQYHSEQSLF